MEAQDFIKLINSFMSFKESLTPAERMKVTQVFISVFADEFLQLLKEQLTHEQEQKEKGLHPNN